MSIHNITEKIKSIGHRFVESIVTVVVITLVSLGSFFLGRFSNNNNIYESKVLSENKIIDSKTNVENNDEIIEYTKKVPQINKEEGKYLASKNGKMYYPVSCKSASRIKDKNRVYFKTEDDAKYLGYRKAENCK